MSGIDHLDAIRTGQLPPPPIAAHFDFRIVSVEPGQVGFTCTPDESAYNPIGLVHGGLVCTLLDSVTGCAVQSHLARRHRLHERRDQGELPAPRARPHRRTESRAAGSPSPAGRIAFAEGEVRDAAGKVVATASSTCLIMEQ